MIFEPKDWQATESQWRDADWQLSHLIQTPEELFRHLPAGEFPEVALCHPVYGLRITPYYLSLAARMSPQDPILRQCLPAAAELRDSGNGEEDGLDEERCSPVPRLVHRYPDRALYVTGNLCGVHCRHCMRKRNWGQPLPPPGDAEIATAAGYLREHPEVREVLVSGGDPLMLPRERLRRILAAFAAVPSIEMLRIGSRLPVVLPMRLTPEYCRFLADCGKPVWLATHFNHPLELTGETGRCVDSLLAAGIPVVNQSVLLKGVNDDAETLRRLFTGLLRCKIKPYYLFHGDPILGTTHFRTGVRRGLELMDQLRGRVSGLALPAFAFDLPRGAGKIRLEPETRVGVDPRGAAVYRSYQGREIPYPDW